MHVVFYETNPKLQ